MFQYEASTGVALFPVEAFIIWMIQLMLQQGSMRIKNPLERRHEDVRKKICSR